MRHRKEGRKLSRTASHRRALLSALSTALIKHKKIKTTVAKAKEARRIVEPLITRARNAYQQEKAGGAVNVAARRHITKFIRDREAIMMLFSEIAEKVGARAGGYTRVVKLGRRLGDAAQMAVLELVDYNLAQDTSKRKTLVAKSRAAHAKKSAKGEAEAIETRRGEPKRTRRGHKKSETKSAVEETGQETAEAAQAEAAQDSPEAEALAEEPRSEKPKS